MKSAAVFLFALLLAGAAEAQTLSGPALTAALRQGGYVLVMRHASSPNTIPSKAEAAAGNFAPERQLDAKGEATARAMGEAFKALRIPIGPVLSSPTFRAVQTTRYGQFGMALPVPELGEGAAGMAGNAEEERRAWLDKKIKEMPPMGKDMLLVTHAPNITGAFGQAAAGIAEGEAMIFHPDGKGGAPLVARVRIDEWPALAASK